MVLLLWSLLNHKKFQKFFKGKCVLKNVSTFFTLIQNGKKESVRKSVFYGYEHFTQDFT